MEGRMGCSQHGISFSEQIRAWHDELSGLSLQNSSNFFGHFQAADGRNNHGIHTETNPPTGEIEDAPDRRNEVETSEELGRSTAVITTNNCGSITEYIRRNPSVGTCPG